MTARVIPLRSAEVIEFPFTCACRPIPATEFHSEPAHCIDYRRREAARPVYIGDYLDDDADAKLRIYERICGDDDDGGTAA